MSGPHRPVVPGLDECWFVLLTHRPLGVWAVRSHGSDPRAKPLAWDGGSRNPGPPMTSISDVADQTDMTGLPALELYLGFGHPLTDVHVRSAGGCRGCLAVPVRLASSAPSVGRSDACPDVLVCGGRRPRGCPLTSGRAPTARSILFVPARALSRALPRREISRRSEGPRVIVRLVTGPNVRYRSGWWRAPKGPPDLACEERHNQIGPSDRRAGRTPRNRWKHGHPEPARDRRRCL